MEFVSEFVASVDDDDLTRHRINACIYCGNTTSLTRDHVIPVSWTGFKRTYLVGDVVQAGKECNYALGNKPFFSISKRANYLYQHYSRKYLKILNHPHWDDDELEEMSTAFQSTLKSRNSVKSFVMARLSHCALVSLEDASTVSVKQQSMDDITCYRILCDFYFGIAPEKISEKYEIELKLLMRMFRDKKYSKIVNAFKYERQIPFDYSIYRLFKRIRDDLAKKEKK